MQIKIIIHFVKIKTYILMKINRSFEKLNNSERVKQPRCCSLPLKIEHN